MREIPTGPSFLEGDSEEEFIRQIPETEKKFETLPPEEAKKQLLALFEEIKTKKFQDDLLFEKVQLMNLPEEVINSPEIIAAAKDLLGFLFKNSAPNIALFRTASILVDSFKSSDEILAIPEIKQVGELAIKTAIRGGRERDENKFIDEIMTRYAIPKEFLSSPEFIDSRFEGAFRRGGSGAMIELADELHLPDEQLGRALRKSVEWQKKN